jgi:hypothetical protein
MYGALPHTPVHFLARPRKRNQKKGAPGLFLNGLFQDCSVHSRNSLRSDSLECLTLAVHYIPKTING